MPLVPLARFVAASNLSVGTRRPWTVVKGCPFSSISVHSVPSTGAAGALAEVLHPAIRTTASMALRRKVVFIRRLHSLNILLDPFNWYLPTGSKCQIENVRCQISRFPTERPALRTLVDYAPERRYSRAG